MSNKERRRADINDVNIRDTGGDGISAKDADLNVSRFNISNTKGNGISSDGKGNVLISHGVISNAEGHGIVIGQPRAEEVMAAIARIVESQPDVALKELLAQNLEKFKQSSEESQKKAILRSIVDVLIQRGLGTTVEQAMKRFGDFFNF